MVKIEIKGGEQLGPLARDFEKIVIQELGTALNSTLQEGEKIVKNTIREANAVASGTLLRSVTALINSLSDYDWNLAGEIAFRPPADEYVNQADKGRGPSSGGGQGSEFFNRIVTWLGHKGMDVSLAYPIVRSINAHGTNVGGWSRYNRTAFLDTSVKRVESAAVKEFDKVAARIQRRVDSYVNTNSSGT